MKLGIRGHDLGKNSPKAFAESVRKAKLNSLQLVLPKAIDYKSEKPLILNDSLIDELCQQLEENNVEVAMMGAYFNPIHSDKEKVADTVENFKNHLQKAHRFGTNLVGTETGSYNDDEWTWHENNGSEAAFSEVLSVFASLLPTAEETGTYLTIEPAYHHVISSPQRLKRLVDALDSNRVKVIFDLFNLLHDGNYENQRQLVDEMVELFSDKIEIVHAKDFIVQDGKVVQVAPGKGMLDYKYLLNKLETLQTKPQIIFEGVTGEDIEFSRQYLTGLIA